MLDDALEYKKEHFVFGDMQVHEAADCWSTSLKKLE